MLSKRISISSEDLTSGELLTDIHITKTFSASNSDREEVWYPTAINCFNNSGQHIVLVLLTSGDLVDYQADASDRDGIVVGYDSGNGQTFQSDLAPNYMYLNVIADGALTDKVEISLYNYQKLF